MNFIESKKIFGSKRQTDKCEFEFKLADEIDGARDIAYIQPSCGACVTAEYVPELNSVIGVLDLSKAQSVYNNHRTAVNKNVTVYYNDGEPHFTSGSDKKIKANPKKKKDVLKLSAVVVVPTVKPQQVKKVSRRPAGEVRQQ